LLLGRRALLTIAAAAALILWRARPGYTRLDLGDLLTAAGVAGLLTLGQRLLRRAGGCDLAAGATMAFGASLLVGLAGVWPLPAAIAAALLATVLIGLAQAAAVRLTGAPLGLVSVVTLTLLPAAASEPGARLAPDALRAWAAASPGGLPTAAWLWLAAFGATLALRRCKLPLPAACAAAGLGWGLLALLAAGTGAPGGGVSPAALGLGGALLAGDDALGLLLAPLLLATLGQLAGGERGALVVAAGALLAGLALAGRSAHAEQLDPHAVHLEPVGAVEVEGEPPPLAGCDGHQTDGL
jgi:hypothetical protein